MIWACRRPSDVSLSFFPQWSQWHLCIATANTFASKL